MSKYQTSSEFGHSLYFDFRVHSTLSFVLGRDYNLDSLDTQFPNIKISKESNWKVESFFSKSNYLRHFSLCLRPDICFGRLQLPTRCLNILNKKTFELKKYIFNHFKFNLTVTVRITSPTDATSLDQTVLGKTRPIYTNFKIAIRSVLQTRVFVYIYGCKKSNKF